MTEPAKSFIDITDTTHLPHILGVMDQNLALIGTTFGVNLSCRGARITASGAEEDCESAIKAVRQLQRIVIQRIITTDSEVSPLDVQSAIHHGRERSKSSFTDDFHVQQSQRNTSHNHNASHNHSDQTLSTTDTSEPSSTTAPKATFATKAKVPASSSPIATVTTTAIPTWHPNQSVPTFKQGGGKQGGITRGKSASMNIAPLTKGQDTLIKTMHHSTITFAVGAAGSGKTFLAVWFGVMLLQSGAVNRLVISRPVVEAGERLGFLPGDLKEKIDPYLIPVYDVLSQLLGAESFARRLQRQEIEIAPLAFMRGRTFKRAFVILDEAQNATKDQLHMFLTRLGEGSRMVITGDPSQSDLFDAHKVSRSSSGLITTMNILRTIDDIGMVTLTAADVVRHPLVAKIVRAFAGAEKRKPEPESRDLAHTSTTEQPPLSS